MQKRWLDWPITPIQGVKMSASGLLALADLSTSAKRTVLTGTSTWLDVLVLVPGLHYQQAAESLGDSPLAGMNLKAFHTHSGTASDVTNAATIQYLLRIGNKIDPVIIDIGPSGLDDRRKNFQTLGSEGRKYERHMPTSSKISNFLYFIGPFLTITALVLLILTQDWWGVGIILALMLARALNVWVIKQRTSSKPVLPPSPNVHQTWWINIDGQSVCLRGLTHDLEAITTGQWMKKKTNVEGYLEAAAKLIVFLVAIFSGNTYQIGNIILIVLLLVSSGLLALSNAHADTFSMNGRVASVAEKTVQQPVSKRNLPPIEQSRGAGRRDRKIDDLERQEEKVVVDNAYPYQRNLNYV